MAPQMVHVPSSDLWGEILFSAGLHSRTVRWKPLLSDPEGLFLKRQETGMAVVSV